MEVLAHPFLGGRTTWKGNQRWNEGMIISLSIARNEAKVREYEQEIRTIYL